MRDQHRTTLTGSFQDAQDQQKKKGCTINIEDTVLVLIATGHDFLQKFHHRGCVRPFTVPN